MYSQSPEILGSQVLDGPGRVGRGRGAGMDSITEKRKAVKREAQRTQTYLAHHQYKERNLQPGAAQSTTSQAIWTELWA